MSIRKPKDGSENFQIDVITSWEKGNIYLAKVCQREGKIESGSMCTLDVKDGEASEYDYNWIDVYLLDGQLHIEARGE